MSVACHGAAEPGGKPLGAPPGLAQPRRLALGPARLELVAERLVPRLLGLLAVDRVDQHALVLEDVTLDAQVELVVEVAVDLFRVAVLFEEAAKDAHAAHPEDLGREAGLAGTVGFGWC